LEEKLEKEIKRKKKFGGEKIGGEVGEIGQEE
jgi:hypothetical protein